VKLILNYSCNVHLWLYFHCIVELKFLSVYFNFIHIFGGLECCVGKIGETVGRVEEESF
jgi:hypothetical protein